MHTTKYLGDPDDYDDSDITFQHNGDYSGIVIVNIPAGYSDTVLSADHVVSVRVPYAAMEYLVTEKIRAGAIEILENMSASDFLDMTVKGELQEKFIAWLASLDNDTEARRKVTLQGIIEYAKKVKDEDRP